MHHVPHIEQGLGRQAAFAFQVAVPLAVVEERLQIVHTQGVHVKPADVRLDVSADVKLVAAVGGQLYRGADVDFQPPVQPVSQRDNCRNVPLVMVSDSM